MHDGSAIVIKPLYPCAKYQAKNNLGGAHLARSAVLCSPLPARVSLDGASAVDLASLSDWRDYCMFRGYQLS